MKSRLIFNVRGVNGFFRVRKWSDYERRTTQNSFLPDGRPQREVFIMADQFFMTQKGYDEAVERLKPGQQDRRRGH